MTPLGRFISGLLSTSVGKASVVILGLAGLMITTREVSPAELGVYVLLIAVVVFLTEFSAAGISLAVSQRLVRNLPQREEEVLLGTALNFRVASSLLVGLSAYVAAGPVFALFGGEAAGIASALVYLPVLVLLESLVKLAVSVLEGKFRFRAIGFSSVLGSVSNFAGIAILVLLLHHGLIGLLLAKVFSRTLTLAYCIWAAEMRPSHHFDRSVLSGLLRFGFPLQLNFILSYMFVRADTFLISVLLGPAQVAFYEIARRIPDSLGDAYDAFVQVYFPFVSEQIEGGNRIKAAEMITASVRWIAFGALFVALVATLFGHGIIILLFTETYAPSVAAFYLLCVSLSAYLVDSTLGYALIAAGQGSKIPVFNSIRAVASFGLYFVFIGRWALPGAAAAAILSIAIVLPLNLIYLRRADLHVSASAVVRPFAIYAALAVLAAALGPIGIVVKIVILLAYPLLSLVFAAITTREARDAGRELRRLFVANRPEPARSSGKS